MQKTIIGVSALYHDSAAAAVAGGEILAAAQEERFSRRKHDPAFPVSALEYCIERAGGIRNVDGAAFYEDPVLSFDRVLRNSLDLARESEPLWPGIAASQLVQKLGVLERLRGVFGAEREPDIFIVDHHTSHMASAFYPSPFHDAAIVVADGIGEWASTTIGEGNGSELTALAQIHYPHSLGLFYSAFTYHCGLKVNSAEYKLMGLAPYGKPRYVSRILDNMIDLREDGSFLLNTEFFGFLAGDRMTSAAFEKLLGTPRRRPESPLSPVYMDLAASAQEVIDRAMAGLARRALAITERHHLCLAGGVALNCVTNGRLLRGTPGLAGLWIQPAAGDAGGALGAALFVTHRHFACSRHSGVGRVDGQKGSLLGPSFTESQIEQALRELGLQWRLSEDGEEHVDRVAQALADGLIVGRFEGPMEFGPRALGNRSILADARRADGQSYINRKIKFRESWRPFAPAILADQAARYFDLPEESPYMSLVAGVKEEFCQPMDWSGYQGGDGDMMELVNQRRSCLPAVTHIDYSASVQTVDPYRNPSFHRLLQRFFEKTGCPALVNTSFNVRGEPIVCTPADAVGCFLQTGIDLLAIGRFLVFKSEQKPQYPPAEGNGAFEFD
jgi:carbamoyltransferase